MLPRPGLPHVLAGAVAADRRRIASPTSGPRWFEPMHVREPGHVRDELTAQVVAGADFIVAPTWLTHRRALVPVGESRRVREWTQAAVDVARQATEIGRERQDGAHLARILGVLPDPEDVAEGATGKLPPADAAVERDERDQAGILADAGVDGVLIERRPSLVRARGAVRAVVACDLPAWVVVPLQPEDGQPLAAWREELTQEGVAMLLLEVGGPPTEALAGELDASRFGTVWPEPPNVADARGVADAWLALGAQVLGIQVGATPAAIGPLVAACDGIAEAAATGRAATQATTDAWVTDAMRRAAGGRALWIGDAPDPLPQGFSWTVVSPALVRGLPMDHWRLIVSDGPLAPDDACRLLERGGIVAAAADDEPDTTLARARAAGLRVDTLTNDGRYIARRED